MITLRLRPPMMRLAALRADGIVCAMHRSTRKRKLGEVIEMTFPGGTLDALQEVIASDRLVPIDSALQQARGRLEAKRAEQARAASFVHYLDAERYERMALAMAWERTTGKRVPKGCAIVLLDGKRTNLQAGNLYCLPSHELASWLRFVRTPIAVHVARLEKQVMTLKTSEDVKAKLLTVIDQLADTSKPPDILRQRAICETVQALVGLLKVEVAYVRAIDGDGVVPFLEPARQEAQKRREAAGRRPPLLGGPAPSHPWRGLGRRE